MDKQQANRRVAEILGWTEVTQRSNDSQTFGKGPKGWDVIPYYCADLNACQEMEKALVGRDVESYCFRLERIARMHPPQRWKEVSASWVIDACLIFATAEQRTEAFLRVKDPGFFK